MLICYRLFSGSLIQSGPGFPWPRDYPPSIFEGYTTISDWAMLA